MISTLDSWFGTCSWFLPGKRGGRTAERRAAIISTLDTWFGTADFYLGNVVGEQLRGEQLLLRHCGLEQLISTWETRWENIWGESSYSNIYLRHVVWNSWFLPGKRGVPCRWSRQPASTGGQRLPPQDLRLRPAADAGGRSADPGAGAAGASRQSRTGRQGGRSAPRTLCRVLLQVPRGLGPGHNSSEK